MKEIFFQMPGLVPSAIIGVLVWFIRGWAERRWGREERKDIRKETETERLLTLIRELTGHLESRFRWLIDHLLDDGTGAAADEIAGWIYRHATNFPDEVAKQMHILAHKAYSLRDPERTKLVSSAPDVWIVLQAADAANCRLAWEQLRKYQQDLENRLYQ